MHLSKKRCFPWNYPDIPKKSMNNITKWDITNTTEDMFIFPIFFVLIIPLIVV